MNNREEQPGEEAAIRSVNLTVFRTSTEADLVDALRREAAPIISLVAEEDENVIGHILFSPATLVAEPKLPLMGLAPMAVLPARQRVGIGSRLVVEGIERCRRANVTAVVVLGRLLSRFGFVRASRLSLRCEYDVPANAGPWQQYLRPNKLGYFRPRAPASLKDVRGAGMCSVAVRQSSYHNGVAGGSDAVAEPPLRRGIACTKPGRLDPSAGAPFEHVGGTGAFAITRSPHDY